MKRVVYISATDEVGGSDTSLFELVRCLDRTRYEPHVVLPHRGPFAARYATLGVPVHVVPVKKLKNTKNPLWHFAWVLRAPLRVVRIARLLARLRPDVVNVNSSVEWLAGVAARRHCSRTSARLVWHVRESELRPACVERALFGTVRRCADVVVAISTPLAARLRGRAPVRVIHNGVDVRRLAATPRAADGRTILWVGRIAPGKGLENVLAAFRRVRARCADARLLVHGARVDDHVAYAARLRAIALATDLEGHVEWHDGGGAPDAAFARGDVFVHLPDVREGLGRTVVEAQAAGMPVVTWPHGGLVDAVDADRTGRFVPVADVAAAADALVELLTDTPLRERMAAAAVAFAAGFASERTARLVEDVYEGALR